MLFRFTLRAKLLLFILIVALIPLLTASVFQSVYSRQITSKLIDINENAIAQSTSDMINDWISNQISQLSELIKLHPEFNNPDRKQILPVIKVLNESDADIEGCTFVDKNGNAVNDAGTDMVLSDRDYYKKAKETKKPVISDILVSKSTGHQIIVVAVPIIDAAGNYQGHIHSSIAIDRIIKRMSTVNIAGTGYAYLKSQTGVILSHPDESLVGKGLDEVFNPGQAQLFRDTVLTEDMGNIQYAINGEKKIAAFSKVALTGWRVVVTAPTKEVYADNDKALQVSAIIIIAAVLLIVAASVLMARIISNPILYISRVVKEAAQGDITGRTKISSRDELGELAANINGMFEAFSSIIGNVKLKADEVDGSAMNLSATSQELASASQEVANSVQHVAKGASEQSQNLTDVLSRMNNFSISLDNIYSSLERIKGSTEVTEKLSNEGSGQMKEMTTATRDVSQSLYTVIKNVGNLNENIRKIDEITAVIKDISDQTNLLALNAAIEAARAGEAGKGFAVVAEEIRKLADQSRVSADNIAQVIKSILAEAEGVAGMSNEVESKLSVQIEQINFTTRSFEGILNSVFETTPMIKHTFEEADSLIKERDNVLHNIQSVASISEQTSAATQEISASAEEMSASTEEIASTSNMLQQVSTELVNNIRTFKI